MQCDITLIPKGLNRRWLIPLKLVPNSRPQKAVGFGQRDGERSS